MTAAFGSASAWAASGGTAVSPSYPTGIAAGDLLILAVGQKPSVANSGTATASDGTWTLLGTSGWEGGYGTTVGVDQGNLQGSWWTKVATGSESGTTSVALTSSSSAQGMIIRVTMADAENADLSLVTYGSATTPMTGVTLASDPGATAGDLVLSFMFDRSDSTAGGYAIAGPSVSWPGVVISASTGIAQTGTTLGNDMKSLANWHTVTSGTSSGAPTMSSSTLYSPRGPGGVLRIREPSVGFVGWGVPI